MRDEDRDETRRRLADAALRVVASDGVAGLSMRAIAAEAASSLGLVQRVLGSKHDVLAICMQRVIERVDARATDIGPKAGMGPAEALRRLIDVLLADGHDEEGRLWAAFSAQALVDPALAEAIRAQEDEAENVFALLLAGLVGPGALHVDDDALGLLALVNGLGQQILLGRCTAQRARQIAHHHLARLERGSDAR